MMKLLERLGERWRLPYNTVGSSDFENEDETDLLVDRKGDIRRFSFTVLVALSCVCLATGFASGYLSTQFSTSNSSRNLPSSKCTEPVVRREWRSLTDSERSEYVHAVKCLSTTSSKLGLNATTYDDFAWLHRLIGMYSHHSASFLPWHRYTLHIYEKTLREMCGFKGNLPYWDWSLDWRDIAKSSIWDSKSGFGGDGDVDGSVTVGGGRCVVDGPFSDLRPVYYNHSYIPHCLSRGFQDGNTPGRISGWYARPENIGILLLQPTYSEFVSAIELSAHDGFHNSIGGDFMAFTASNDPLFYLHHAQLDRLWWQWQRQNPKQRLTEYYGRHMANATDEGTLEARLLLAGFASDVSVSEVMNTENKMLCYNYQ